VSELDKVEISTELGAFMECDLGAISKWQNSIEDKRLVMGFRFPVSDMTSAEWLKQRMLPLPKHPSTIYWAIRAKNEQTLLGYVVLFDIDYISGTAEIGIYLESHRRSGAGTVSIFECLDRAKRDLHLRKILARTLSSNTSALRLFEKTGFHQEGILSSQYWDGIAYHDVQILSQFI